MKYQLKVFSISELGKRNNQEDCIYPQGGESGNLYILCDGMGGHEKGEVASATVCDAMSRFISESYSGGVFSENDFNKVLDAAYNALDTKDGEESHKMGTTLTFLLFHEGGCFMAHIGDSRIYHIRPSEYGADRILHVTRDHSLVNDLIAIGELTPEEAKTSKQRNIITKALQPHSNRYKADVFNVTDIRPGDYFYMCSDGMVENMDDMEIADILSTEEHTDEMKVSILREITEDNRDNHSAHLINVVNVEYDNMTEAPAPKSRMCFKKYIILVVLFFLAASFVIDKLFPELFSGLYNIFLKGIE